MRNEIESVNNQYNKVLLWEKGFAQYNEIIDTVNHYPGGRPTAAITRKLNDAIRMMAEADYEGLIDMLGDCWMIRRALAKKGGRS